MDAAGYDPSTVALGLMGTLDETTSLLELAAFMLAIGLGVGMVIQNLVLVVQSSLDPRQIAVLLIHAVPLGTESGIEPVRREQERVAT
jgi:hypothetical protein